MILSSTDNLTNAIILHVHRELELREESFMFTKERLFETQALLYADVQQVYGILQVGGGFHKFCTVKSVVI